MQRSNERQLRRAQTTPACRVIARARIAQARQGGKFKRRSSARNCG